LMRLIPQAHPRFTKTSYKHTGPFSSLDSRDVSCAPPGTANQPRIYPSAVNPMPLRQLT
jgi:hypothetical protein